MVPLLASSTGRERRSNAQNKEQVRSSVVDGCNPRIGCIVAPGSGDTNITQDGGDATQLACSGRQLSVAKRLSIHL
ncbi:hypothetical protein LY76DRAFT_175833 [Colletotrichum caudatum]|nr:hypothetical protein LY76DRAFT_175833 [Colletotrichum caudatum]